MMKCEWVSFEGSARSEGHDTRTTLPVAEQA